MVDGVVVGQGGGKQAQCFDFALRRARRLELAPTVGNTFAIRATIHCKDASITRTPHRRGIGRDSAKLCCATRDRIPTC